MGEGRALAARAGAPAPDKRDRLERSTPCLPSPEHPGALMWKPNSAIRGEDAATEIDWRLGADEAKAFRFADADRYNQIHDAARTRRKERR